MMTPDELKILEARCEDTTEAAVLLASALEEGECQQIQEALRSKNFRVEILEGTDVHNKSNLLEALGKTFGFPGYYGVNWAALNDCLSNPEEWTKPVHEAGVILVYRNAQVLKTEDPDAIKTLMEIIETVQEGWRQEGKMFRFCMVLDVFSD